MSRLRPSRARLQALEEARQSEKLAAMTEHAKLVGEIAAFEAEKARTGSRLFDGFSERLAEHVEQLFELRLSMIDDRYRRLGGQLPPAMKS